MPKGPRGERRPADVVGAAIRVARISVGDETEDAPKALSQAKGGQRGGAARALKLTDEQRTEIARAAAQARWKKT